jgi:hypothetical protein
MPPTPKAVLISLADNANDQGECWPSLAKICERTCYGKTAVVKALAWLEEKGAIHRERSTGGHATNYTITPGEYTSRGSGIETSEDCSPSELSASRTVRLAETNCSPREPELSASRTGTVRLANTNRKEPSGTVKSNRHGAKSGIELPEWLPADAWREFVAHRRAIGKKLGTDYAKQLAIGKLDKLRIAGHEPRAVIDQSIANGWQGLFEIKPEGAANGRRADLFAQAPQPERPRTARKLGSDQ